MTRSEPRPAAILGALLGNYRVLATLGQGGMGEVYVGRHEALGNRVAIKVLQLELSRDTEMVQRFFNEAQAATAIRHPGIVQVFDFGVTADGRCYFVMELLEGQTLAARLKQRRLDYAECCRLGRQAANALQAAHAAGITHRDLKPDNLFLVTDTDVVGGERVKVLDFGIAKLAGDEQTTGLKTRTGLVLGTPHYMSPEQCRGAGLVDARSDVYALGCILFEMVCGRPPFVEEGLGGLLGAHQYVEPPQPKTLAPDVPPKLGKLIFQMLAKQPGERPQTMAAVGQALEELLNAPGGAPKRAPTVRPTPPPPASDTTIRGSAGMSTGRSAGSRWLAFVIGGGVAVGALAVVIAVAAGGSDPGTGPGSPEPAVADAAIAAVTPDAAPELAAPPAIVDAEEESTDLPAPPATPAQGDPATAQSEIEIECLRYQASQQWDDLDACAERLKPTNPTVAKQLKERAILEIRAVPRIAAFETAIRDRNLKIARAQLEAISPQATSYAKLRLRYEQAENEAIRDLAQRLERVKKSDCKEYNQLLQQEKSSKPARVANEAQRQVRCTPAQQTPPPAACNAEELAEKGKEQFMLSQLASALAAYEAAYICKPEQNYAEKAFITACNIPNLGKAKAYWKRMPGAMRTRALGVCIRNGITEDMLDRQ